MTLRKKEYGMLLLAERDPNIRIVPMPIESWHPTCFEGGPCTNPFHDCINCPHQDSGGTWETKMRIMYDSNINSTTF